MVNDTPPSGLSRPGPAQKRPLRSLITRGNLLEAVRYFFASLAALVADTAVLIGLHSGLDLNTFASAFVGFSVGIVVIYFLSIRHVFSYRRLEETPGSEMKWFWISGAIGLAVTVVSVPLLADYIGLPLLAAKIVTAGFVFTFNYLFRKIYMFTDWSDS